MSNIRLIRTLLKYLRLDAETDDYQKIHTQIQKDVIFRGTNLWVLIFAIFIASVGLNINSTAVIIGAMLISPLLGPIIGIGYSIGIFHIQLFKTSLKNFMFAVIASLIASSLYFYITPLSEASSELLARTTPTIYDVLIAIFGGFAGIIATSSKQKGNVIAGVAIATALIPPLCTCGYGISTAQWHFFAGAFYLFIINSFFIALASLIVTRLLNFPIYIAEKANFKIISHVMFIFTIIVLLPSIYLGYKFIQKEHYRSKAEKFISHIVNYKGNYLLRHEIDPSDHVIKLTYAGHKFSSEELNQLKSLAAIHQIDTSKIIVQYGLHIDDILSKSNSNNYNDELINLKFLLNSKTHKIDSIESLNQIGKSLLNESRIFYPQIKSITYYRAYSHQIDTSYIYHYVIVGSENNMLNSVDREKFSKWLSNRLNTKMLKIFYEILDKN